MSVAAGIDVAQERRGFDLVALDETRAVVWSEGRLAAGDVAGVVGELEPAVVCIDSPPGWSTSARSRLAERQLARLRVHAFATGPDPGPHPFYAWMRAGFSVYAAVEATHPRYRGGGVRGTAAEIFPHATAVFLARRLPRRDERKLPFRRGVLDAHGVAGDRLETIDRVDAALGALTGLIALEGGHSWLGDPDEGVILLPGPVPEAGGTAPW